jgi:hypothetical protein
MSVKHPNVRLIIKEEKVDFKSHGANGGHVVHSFSKELDGDQGL